MTYEQWLKAVDQYLEAEIGLGHQDLPDQLWRDWYEDGLDPMDAATEALDSEGYYDFAFVDDGEEMFYGLDEL